MPRVSVLMAHAGSPTFVDRACSSIQAQDYRDFELIVVDDAAGIDWDAHLRSVTFPWRALHNSNRQGLARSMNAAARVASGDLLARMDSDDVSAPSRLSREVAFLDRHADIAFLGSSVRWLDEGDRRLGRSYPLTDPEELVVGLSMYNQLCHGSMLIRREAFDSLHGYDESAPVAQDYELWLRAIRAGHRFANLAEPLYGHRLHPHSVSSRAAQRQSDAASVFRSRGPAAEWNSRLTEWFAGGRQLPLGRHHEPLQMGRLALLFLASLAAGRVAGPMHRAVLAFVTRHAANATELLIREVGWRHDTAAKMAGLLRKC